MTAFSRLSRREQMLVAIALPLVIVFAGYRFGWVPLTQARAAASDEIVSYRTLIEAAATQGDQPAPAQSAPPVTTPLATRITRSADAANLLVRRLEPEAAMVRVSLDDAPYEAVIGWIATMEATESIVLVGIEMDRRTAPGIVAARLTLETAK